MMGPKGWQFWGLVLIMLGFLWLPGLIGGGKNKPTVDSGEFAPSYDMNFEEESPGEVAQQDFDTMAKTVPAHAVKSNAPDNDGPQTIERAPGQPENVDYALDTIYLVMQRGRMPIKVAVPQGQESLAFGLMNRDRWPSGIHGMLFFFGGEEREQAMWMKDTYLPLDMVFADKSGKIVHIVENTIPHSEAPISSGQPVAAVLEIPAGSAKAWQITIGDSITFPASPR
jgi:uncharacterized protein